MNPRTLNRRTLLQGASLGLAGLVAGCEQASPSGNSTPNAQTAPPARRDEEYVWLSANANLPMFVAQDHPGLELAAQELGVRATKAGPNSIDIPTLVASLEQVIVRKPAGIMVVGWDPSALVPAINRGIDAGIPIICVDADVPTSKRLCFVGTDWFDIGVQQGRAMLGALNGKKGKIAMLGLIEQNIMQQAFEGFRSVMIPAGCTCLDPQQDKGNQAEATRVASAVLQATPELVGIAGFDSESGPGIGQALKELGKAGQIVATTVQAEGQVLQFIRDGVLTAAVMQKRHLFTYCGLKALYDAVHSPVRFTRDDRKAGISPLPVNISTGTYQINRQNIGTFLA